MNILHAGRTALTVAMALGTAGAFGCDDNKTTGAGSSSAKAADKSAAPTARSAAPAAAKVASCNVIKAESMCREWGDKNVEAAGEDSLKSTCQGVNGEFKLEACPKDKRVGSCVTPEGTKIHYTDGGLPQDAAAVEKSCKEGQPAGEWKAGT